MYFKSFAFLYILIVAIVSTIAFPADENKWQPKEQEKNWRLEGQGGGNRKDGFDVGFQGSKTVWESNNGRHSVDVNGQYGQHLGGPYGNSRPSWGAGGSYRYRW